MNRRQVGLWLGGTLVVAVAWAACEAVAWACVAITGSAG